MSAGKVRQGISFSRQHWFVLGLVVFFVALSVQYSFKVMSGGSAIERWMPQILHGLDDGENIYDRYTYPNPPIMVLLLYPLAKLPPLAGALLWFYLKLGMTLAAFYWVFRLMQTASCPFPPWAKALTVLLSIRPIMGDLLHGNVNLFILFLVTASLFAFSRKRDLAAGVILALSIACKVTPALFIPYLLWKRAWKALAGCALGLVLFFWIIPGSLLGWEQNAVDLHSWYTQMVKPYVFEGVVTPEHNNQSLPGLVYRLLTASPSFSTYVDGRSTPQQYDNWVDIGPDAARWLLKGCMGVFALLVLWTCRTPSRERSGWRPAAEFSIVLLGMLLFSERTWKHHCVTLMFPFAVLCYYLATARPSWKLAAYLFATLGAVALLMASTSTSLLEYWPHTAKMAQAYGAYVWSYLFLIAALALLLKQPTKVADHPGVRLHPALAMPGDPHLATHIKNRAG